jgi:predicted nuclease of predicted toxin-antitoxin system
MKLLFDQNLSPSLPQKLADIFPNSIHIRNVGMRDATDTEIWNYAKQNDFTIVSKDSDFQQRSLLYVHPPKFVWLRVGNCPVETIEELLRKHSISIHTFGLDETKSHLLLP